MRPRTYRHRDLEVYLCSTRDRYGGSERCDQPPLQRALVDEAVLHHFEEQAFDLDATKAQLATAWNRRLTEARALREQAEREAQEAEERYLRVRRDYQDGHIGASDWREHRAE
jgi:hypothetical protein